MWNPGSAVMLGMVDPYMKVSMPSKKMATQHRIRTILNALLLVILCVRGARS
jgi:hypothetical protein